MDPQFEELAKHIADDVEKRLDSVVVKRLGEAEKRLTEKFTKAEERLSNGAKMNMEELKGVVKLAAEGYGATLERIERQLTDLNTKWDTTISDHDKALKNHGRRITALERRQ